MVEEKAGGGQPHSHLCAGFSPPWGGDVGPPPSAALGVEVQQGAAGEADGKLRGGGGGRGEEGKGGGEEMSGRNSEMFFLPRPIRLLI